MLKKIALLLAIAILLIGCAQLAPEQSQQAQKEQAAVTLLQKQKQLEDRPDQLMTQLKFDTVLLSFDKHKQPADKGMISEQLVRAKQTSVALWADSWAQKIERVSTFAYPVDERGNKLRGQLRVTVEVNRDGSILNAYVDRSSGNEKLDQAALRILRLATPFSRLPLDMLDDTGKPATVLVISRIWNFGKDTDLPKTASEQVGLN